MPLRIRFLVNGRTPEDILRARGLAPLPAPVAPSDSGLGTSISSSKEPSPEEDNDSSELASKTIVSLLLLAVAAVETTPATIPAILPSSSDSTPTKAPEPATAASDVRPAVKPRPIVHNMRKMTKAELKKEGINSDLLAKYDWMGYTAKAYTAGDDEQGVSLNLDHGPFHKSLDSNRKRNVAQTIEFNRKRKMAESLDSKCNRNTEESIANSRPKRQKKGLGNGTKAVQESLREEEQAKAEEEKLWLRKKEKLLEKCLKVTGLNEDDHESSFRYNFAPINLEPLRRSARILEQQSSST